WATRCNRKPLTAKFAKASQSPQRTSKKLYQRNIKERRTMRVLLTAFTGHGKIIKIHPATPGACRLHKRIFAFTLILSISILAAAKTQTKHSSRASAYLPPNAVTAMQKIDPERIRAHVKFLASDLLEGRGTGQRGGDVAAEYIATQFELYGLKPAGDNGTFLQKVPLEGIATQDDSTLTLLPNRGVPIELSYRADFVAMDDTG